MKDRIFGAWTAAIALSACSDAPRFEADLQALFRAECTGCHGGAVPQGDLDLYDDPLGVLVDQPSAQSPLLLVEPGDHLYSYLFHKLNGSQGLAEGAGGTMPLTRPLPPEDVELIAAWIDGGARP